MAPRAPRPCRAMGCPRLCRDGSGYCDQCTPPSGWADERRGTAAERGYGTAWRKRARVVKARDNGLCQRCLKDQIHTLGTEVDHKIPKAQGGTDDYDNLWLLCRPCHDAKTLAERRQGVRG